MKLNEYQKRAMATCMSSCDNVSYMLHNLAAEVGEFAGKVAKARRREEVVFSRDGDMWWNTDKTAVAEGAEELNAELKKEAGDILWQLSGLCHVMGWELEDVATGNLEKLASRKARGVIDGDGDNR